MPETLCLRPRGTVIVPSEMAFIESLDDLLADMRRRQEAPDSKISQSEIARRIKRDQSTVNKWVWGVRSITNASGRELFIVLRGYGYDALEIKAIVEAVEELPYPPQLAEGPAAGSPPRMVTVVYEGSISERQEPVKRELWDVTEGNFDPEDLRVRTVRGGDLATAAGKPGLLVGSRVWLHTTLPPEAGRGAIITQDGVDVFCIWPFGAAEYVTPIDPKSGTPPVLLEPDRTQLVARVVFVGQPHY